MRRTTGASAVIPVAIVGAGPVGLALALGLARHGVRSAVVEKEPATSEHSKAPGVHVRTREILRRWGVEDRFLAAGTLMREFTQHAVEPGRAPLAHLDFGELEPEADRPGLLLVEQADTERLLLDAARESGFCDVRFDAEAVALSASGSGLELTVREDGRDRLVRASFVVGCDGARSFVRDALGLPFEGMTYSLQPMLADVRVADARDAQPTPRFLNDRDGLRFAVRLKPGSWRLVSVDQRAPDADSAVPDDEVRRRAAQLLGAGPVEIVWKSRFRIHLRSSPRFRIGRVLLAGDAAHIHSPVGGMGMNAGIHDADNLAWKLAAALGGGDTERLLESYEVERRAVAVERVSRRADLLTRAFLQTPAALRELAFVALRSLMAVPPIRTRMLRRMAMIDLRYPPSPILNTRDPAAGMRLPNPLLRAPDGRAVRLYDLLPIGPVLLDCTDGRADTPAAADAAVIAIGDRGRADPSGALRALLGGRPGWILVRPDSHVAWARHRLDGMEHAIRHALGLAA